MTNPTDDRVRLVVYLSDRERRVIRSRAALAGLDASTYAREILTRTNTPGDSK